MEAQPPSCPGIKCDDDALIRIVEDALTQVVFVLAPQAYGASLERRLESFEAGESSGLFALLSSATAERLRGAIRRVLAKQSQPGTRTCSPPTLRKVPHL
jgi:hypothetical protein